jgi:hypothetical protein
MLPFPYKNLITSVLRRALFHEKFLSEMFKIVIFHNLEHGSGSIYVYNSQ